jgi:hypothetical protein
VSHSLVLATWNCRMGLGRKREAVERIGADLLVVPEAGASAPPAGEPGVSHAWKGAWAPKGLGVYAFGGWQVEPVAGAPELPWVLPLRLSGPDGGEVATLLSVWTVVGRDGRRPSYTGQLAAAIDAWEPELRAGRAILLGDLNASTDADSSAGRAHAANVRRLAGLGMHSAYHAFVGCEHGREPDMTLRWIARGRRRLLYHCDFVFLPERLLERVRRVEVGAMGEWIESGLSDHAPVVVEIGGGGLPRSLPDGLCEG